jgi:hypothetical protein
LQKVKVEVTFEKDAAQSASKMIGALEIMGALEPEQNKDCNKLRANALR